MNDNLLYIKDGKIHTIKCLMSSVSFSIAIIKCNYINVSIMNAINFIYVGLKCRRTIIQCYCSLLCRILYYFMGIQIFIRC